MNHASRWMIVLGLVAAAAGISLEAPSAHAQEVQVTGPLAGAPAVRKMRIYRDGRFQIQPTFGATLNDDFARTLQVGAQIGYYFTDWLGLNAFFNYAVPQGGLHTGLTEQVEQRGQTTDRNALSLPDPKQFGKQIGAIQYLAGVQATFIPLRGKLSLFQALFVDTDFYIFGGAAFVGVEERSNVVNGECSAQMLDSNPGTCLQTQTARTSRMAIAPTFGVGLSLYLTNYLALTLEYRAFPFRWNTSGTDEAGLNKERQLDKNGEFPDGLIDDADRLFHFNQMFGLGLAFYLPFQGEVTE